MDKCGRVVLKSISLLITVGVVGLIALIGMLWGIYSDAAIEYDIAPDTMAEKRNMRDKCIVYGMMRALSIGVRIKKSIPSIDASKVKKKFMSIEEKIVEASLPIASRSPSFVEKLKTKVKSSHKWLSIVLIYSPHFPRSLRILSLTTSVLTMLFMQAILYPIASLTFLSGHRDSQINVLADDGDVLRSTLNEDLSLFMSDLQNYLSNTFSKDFQKQEFDNMWGLNRAGHFISDTDADDDVGSIWNKLSMKKKNRCAFFDVARFAKYEAQCTSRNLNVIFTIND
jgi:hypothetical protein